ncbi:MAG: NACHT domain-containing protein [Sulfitobacter sp.]
MDEYSAKVTADVSTQLIKDSLEAMFAPLSKFVNVSRAKFLGGFNPYCEYMFAKNSLVRTLYSKNKPMMLEDVYVKTLFTVGETARSKARITDNDIMNAFAIGNRVIVKGNGGSGKTIFLKHLWLTRFKKADGRIPIFIELRRLNDLQSLDLMTFCRSELQAEDIFGGGVFEKLCDAGKFEFIFDGFDEVAREKRKSVERQILNLSEKYRKCCFLVSGREDDRFSSWGAFEVFTVAPLALDDLKILVGKIPFDQKVKKILRESFGRFFPNPP